MLPRRRARANESHARGDLLACPRCRGGLHRKPSSLRCRDCGTTCAIRDGVPRMSIAYLDDDVRVRAEWESQSRARCLYLDRRALINQWEREVLPHLLDQIDPIDEIGRVRGPVLDLGCGVGHLGAVALESGRTDLQLVGLDFQGELLAEARRGYAMLVEGDARRLPFRDGSVSAVVASNSLHHF